MDLFDIGAEVKLARKAAGFTQTQLAERAGVARNRIDGLENNRLPEIGFKTLTKILRAVGLDVRVTTFNAGRPTLDDLQAELERADDAASLGRR